MNKITSVHTGVEQNKEQDKMTLEKQGYNTMLNHGFTENIKLLNDWEQCIWSGAKDGIYLSWKFLACKDFILDFGSLPNIFHKESYGHGNYIVACS